MLRGEDYRKRPRLGDLSGEDPGDAAAAVANAKLEARHAEWLKSKNAEK